MDMPVTGIVSRRGASGTPSEVASPRGDARSATGQSTETADGSPRGPARSATSQATETADGSPRGPVRSATGLVPPPGFLSRFAHVTTWHGQLPHWECPGVAVFVTFRLGDALPQERLRELAQDLDSIHLQKEVDHEAWRLLRAKVETWHDQGAGSCLFARPEIRQEVEASIHYYDGRRYVLYSHIVMPNHVHLLFMPQDGQTIQNIVRDLKHFLSVKFRSLKTWNGEFWQREYWDSMIRDERHFQKALNYIKGNSPAIAYSVYEVKDV